MEITIWLILIFILYTYLGYPLILFFGAKVTTKVIDKNFKYEPNVSVVIAAYNEEKNIEKRIKNILGQNYPREKLEVIIVSDGSSDQTDLIIKKIQQQKNINFLKLCTYPVSQGKAHAINQGVNIATGEIIVFADSRQRFETNAIKHLVANFNDQKIGCVSGELKFEDTPDSSINNEVSIYWNFEKQIRKMESHIGSVPGATGAIYAIRKKLYSAIPAETLLDDVLIPMKICLKGYRTVFDGHAIAYDVASKNVEQEQKRKIRTLAGNWQLFIIAPELMNPFKNPIWINFISHKIFRIFVPYAFLLFILNLIYLQRPVDIFILALLSLLFTMAFFRPPAFLSKKLIGLFHISKSVVLLNYFALLAPIKFFFSRKKIWQKRS